MFGRVGHSVLAGSRESRAQVVPGNFYGPSS